MSLRIKQDARPDGRDWWRWSVWLDGSSEELREVDHVTYTLHPTFPQPVQRVTNRRNGFKLESSGWGEFEIHAEIALKSGQSRKRRHWLKLGHTTTSKGGSSDAQRRVHDKGEDRQPLVFVSSSSADADVARELRDSLAAQGLSVTSSEDLRRGSSWEKALGDLFRRADAAVFVLSSGRPSLWVYREVEMALAIRVPHIVPILVGSNAAPPPELKKFEGIRVDTATDIPAAVERIVEASLLRK